MKSLLKVFHIIDRAVVAFGCLMLCLLYAGMVCAQQPGSVKIRTASVTIELSAKGSLKSAENVLQSEEGVRAEDPTRQAVLLSRVIAVPLDTIRPFLAAGSRWTVTPAVENFTDVQLALRFSADGQQWTSWNSVAPDAHLTTGRDTLVGALQYAPAVTRYIQFRLRLSGSDRRQVHSVLLSFTSPGATPPETLEKLKQQSRRRQLKKKHEQPYPMPEYVTRTEWGCPDGQEPSGQVTATDVTHQIVHHSAGPNSSDDWPAVVRSIWDYHVNTNNWSDIGYNWLVDPDGIIYQGRGWIDGNDEVQGAHFCGTNGRTTGLCLLGNFEEIVPRAEAVASLEELLAWKADQKKIDPLTEIYHEPSGLYLHTISGHRDGCSTLCPGENLYADIPKIRQSVASLIGEPVLAGNDITSVANYPNPFSETTRISFSLAAVGRVRITVWDVTGKRLHTVSDRFYDAGEHTELWDASGYASGIYFCRVNLGGQTTIHKMLLVR